MNDRLTSFKYLLILAIPIFIEVALQIVVGYSDQIMMSKYENAVNGISNANTIINTIIYVFQVFATAGVILIAQYKGALNKEKETEAYASVFWFNILTSLILSLCVVIFSRFYLRWLQVPDSAYKDALIYSLITGGFIFSVAGTQTLSGFLKANSMMKESMIINCIINIINIIGNLVLIYLFSRIDLAIIGVALSSTLSRIIGFIIMLIVYKKKVGIPLKFSIFIKNIKTGVIKLVKIGLPSGGETVSYQVSQIVIQIGVNRIVRANDNNVGIGNIKTYASMYAVVSYLITNAVSQAMQVIIGQLLGAKRQLDAKKKVYQTLLLSTIASTSVAFIFYLFSDACFKLFNITDPELLKVAKYVMLVEIVLELGRAFNVVFVRALQTAGDVIFPTVLAIIFCWSVAVVGSFLLGGPEFLNLGLVGVWIAMAADECIRAIIFIFRFRSNRWMKYDLTV